MRILTKYVISELFRPFIFGVAIFLLVFIGGRFLFEITKLLVEKNATFLQALLLFVYGLAPIFVWILPMATLLGVILGLGRFSNDGEIVAFFTSGISLWRILLPIIVFSSVVSITAFCFNEYVVPFANKRVAEIEREIARAGNEQENIVTKEERNGEVQFVLYAKKLRPQEGILENVVAIEFWQSKPTTVLSAKRALWQEGKWLFQEGEMQTLEGKNISRVYFREKAVLFPRSPEEIARGNINPEEMSLRQLARYIRQLRLSGKPFASLLVYLHRKIADPLAAVVLAILGIPFGLKPYKGKSIGVGLSVIVIFIYYVVWHYTAIIGEKGLLNPYLSAYIPNILGIFAGIILLARSPK
ncbi:LptF/LptG family permease [bacterium]|nr:LptF/LptG family permease [bacterium]